MVKPMVKRDMEKWYEALQAKAASVNHTVTVVVAGGELYEGKEVTLSLLGENAAAPLAEALKRIDEYLSSPEAEARGELYSELANAEEAQVDAITGMVVTAARVRAARRALNEDTAARLNPEDSDGNDTNTASTPDTADTFDWLDPAGDAAGSR